MMLIFDKMKFTHRLDGFSSRFPPPARVPTAMPKPLRAHAAHVGALDGISPVEVL